MPDSGFRTISNNMMLTALKLRQSLRRYLKAEIPVSLDRLIQAIQKQKSVLSMDDSTLETLGFQLSVLFNKQPV